MLKFASLNYTVHCTQYLSHIRHLGDAVLLDSGFPACTRGRYDIISAQPLCKLTFSQGVLSSENLPFALNDEKDPFAAAALVQSYAQQACQHDFDLPSKEQERDLPFCGGLLGYFSYDLGRAIEVMPNIASKDTQLADMHLGMYCWAIIIDHEKQDSYLIANDLMPVADFQTLLASLREISPQTPEQNDSFSLTSDFQSNLTQDAYTSALKRIDEYILSGDCYQVNFAQRLSAKYQGDPLHAYLKLREAAPTHFSAFIDTPQGAILSLSPERFLKVDQQQNVVTQPIKGTQPRSTDSAIDNANKVFLQNSEKDRSENLMIVDLMRNDLSKNCQLHSVKVPSLFAIESYKNVHHLVSTVTGKLSEQATALDLLKDCFPGGSITGAPKIRAMEIIDELEPHRRSIYCGSIGYISLCGQMDTSICIRTLLAENNQIHCWGGGGIVADSKIAQEYQETFDKVNNLLNALRTEDLEPRT